MFTCVPRKGGLQKGCLFARWLSFITSDAAFALVLAMLRLLLPLQARECLSSSIQPCTKQTPHSCRVRRLAGCPLLPYSQGTGRRGGEDPLWRKAWCGNSHPFQLPGFQSNLIMKSQPLPHCKHLCYSFLRVALSYRVQGIRQTHDTGCMLIAWLLLPIGVFVALAFSSFPLAGSSYSILLVVRDEGGIPLWLYYFSK